MKINNTFAASLAGLLCSGCASLQEPVRPDYQGTDTVTNAIVEQVVGKWRVLELNPYPDAPAQETLIEYLADGRVIGTLDSFNNEPGLPDDLSLVLTGKWTLDADIVTHTDITMTSTDDSPLGSLISDAFNQQTKPPSEANIMQLEADRMVMIGNDGAAMEYRRQPTSKP